MMPTASPAIIAGMLLLAEFCAFAMTAKSATMVVRSFIVALPLLVFIARSPIIGLYALTFFIPLELLARLPNEFFSLYKLLGILTLTSALVHAVGGKGGIQQQRTALHRWVFVVLFFVAASVIWSANVPLSLQAIRRLATLAVFYFLVTRLVNTRERLRVLALAAVAGAAAAAVLAVLAYVTGRPIFDTQTGVMIEGQLRASGASLDSNFFAATVLAMLPFCVFFVPTEKVPLVRLGFIGAGAIIVLGTVFSFSRGGALTLGLIMLGVLAAYARDLEGRARTRALTVSAIVLVVLLVLLPGAYCARVQSLKSPMRGDESIRGRWLYVQFGKESLLERPLGVGAGAFPIAFRESRFNQEYRYYDLDPNQEQGRSAHNMYLEVAVESGILGGLLLVGMIGYALLEGTRTSRHLREKGDRFLLAASQATTLGLLSFAFAGVFLSAQYEKTLWLFLALTPVVKNLAYEGEVFMPDLKKLRRALARRGREP